MSQVKQAHPALAQADGRSLSKRARQAIAVLECANGLAQNHPEQLVVLISSSQPLLQQLVRLKKVNLCGLSETSLKNWGRTQQVPLPLVQGLARLQTDANDHPAVSQQPVMKAPPRSQPVAPRSQSLRSSRASSETSSETSSGASSRARASRARTSGAQVVSLGLALIAIAAAGLFLLKVTQPQRFEQIWQQLNLES
ncbi:MAG: hypothetical protein HC873_01155 [Leptolyngbyaceae cyanobacterium SL_1_1]|nr:hypothetical protein [Leptolyngbyaceae cyanobacterium SL_1_1]